MKHMSANHCQIFSSAGPSIQLCVLVVFNSFQGHLTILAMTFILPIKQLVAIDLTAIKLNAEIDTEQSKQSQHRKCRGKR